MLAPARAQEQATVTHVVLLGDSVFDNASYVAGGPDVIAQLRLRLPPGDRASLLAVDGSVTAGVAHQLARLPPDASHLIVSSGGNDALGFASVLDAPSRSVADTLARLADIAARFRADYVDMLEAVTHRSLPSAFCTIYDPRYPDKIRRRLATTALAIINDVIIREVTARGLPLIDLRQVCDEDADFANPIEPSVAGGNKIAGVIAALLSRHDFSRKLSQVFVG
jgi:hypothetical protein